MINYKEGQEEKGGDNMVWRKWIETKGKKKIADNLGVTEEIVRQWLKYEQRPSHRNIKQLVEMADGEFGYADFFKES